MKISHKEKAEILLLFVSFLTLSLCLSLSPRPPPTGTTSIQLKYVTITEWQLDTQWPVRTFISQCFILVRSQTAEKISKLFQGLEGDQTFLASPLTRPLIYNGLVRARLDSMCLKTYRGSSATPAHRHVPHGEHPFVPQNQKAGLQHRTLHPCKRARQHVKANPATIKSHLPRQRESKRRGGNGERGCKLRFVHQFLSLFLPSQKL